MRPIVVQLIRSAIYEWCTLWYGIFGGTQVCGYFDQNLALCVFKAFIQMRAQIICLRLKKLINLKKRNYTESRIAYGFFFIIYFFQLRTAVPFPSVVDSTSSPNPTYEAETSPRNARVQNPTLGHVPVGDGLWYRLGWGACFKCSMLVFIMWRRSPRGPSGRVDLKRHPYGYGRIGYIHRHHRRVIRWRYYRAISDPQLFFPLNHVIKCT